MRDDGVICSSVDVEEPWQGDVVVLVRRAISRRDTEDRACMPGTGVMSWRRV